MVAQSLSHYSWQYTRGYLMVVDIQGCGNVLTDPQIHCLDTKRFGAGNLGYFGMIKFFITHNCNKYCKSLGLLHPKDAPKLPDNFSFFIDKFSKPKKDVPLNKICELCNKQFCIGSLQYYEKKKEFHEVYCKNCYLSISVQVVEKSCVECKKNYQSSSYWYFMKRMEIPERCSDCRKREREALRKKLE